MSYGTNIPYLMRKIKVSPHHARLIIDNLIESGILREHIENETQPIVLYFFVEHKYGRDLFYPKCDNARVIVESLLRQKSATKKQILIMQNVGWLIKITHKNPLQENSE